MKLPVDAAGRGNCGTTAMTVIGAMLAGGDSIADVDLLRAGAAVELFGLFAVNEGGVEKK